MRTSPQLVVTGQRPIQLEASRDNGICDQMTDSLGSSTTSVLPSRLSPAQTVSSPPH